MKNDYIEQVCVAGLGIPQPIALINLSEVGVAADKATVEASLQDTLKKLNSTSANFERISTVVIQKEPWSEDNGLITPTLKVKRGKLDERYLNQYLDWHEDKSPILWV